MDYSVALLMLPRAPGRNVAIITNAGGVGAIAADEAEKCGLRVEPLGGRSMEKLKAEFKGAGFISNASLGNPFDTTASATTEEFVRMTGSVLSLPEYDAAVVLPTHQTPAVGYDIATRLAAAVRESKKPVVVSVIGNSDFARRIHGEFMSRGVPSFPTPERAVRALAAVRSYSELREIVGRPPILRRRPRRSFGGRPGPMAPPDVSRLLGAYSIEEPRSAIVSSSNDFRKLGRFSFPVACKLLADGITHKTEAGGVLLNVAGVEGAKSAFGRFSRHAKRKRVRFRGMLVQEMVGKSVEVILGGTRDPTFGPVVVFGIGGTYTELIRDYSLMVAPVSPREVKDRLAETELGRVLAGYRGGPRGNIDRFTKVVSAFSRIMVENPQIEQIEVNPLMVRGGEILAADARVVRGRPAS